MRTKSPLFLLLAAVSLLSPLCAHAQSSWHVAKTWPVGGDGGWDYVTVDAASHRIFVTRATHTQVIDEESGMLLADVTGQMRSHGVAIAPKAGRGFITDGGGKGAIVIFDLKTYAVLGKLAAMPDADGIIYDAATNQVIAVSGDGQAMLTLPADVDPVAGKIDPPIMLGGSPEFLSADNDGMAYVNLQDKNVVAKVDLKTRAVVARWPVAPGGRPVGLSIDTEHHRLFVGCRQPQKLVVMSTQDGKMLASLPIGAGVDATAYDGKQAFASCRDGSLTVAGEKGGTFEVQQVVKTSVRSGTLAVDASAGKIFLPAGMFEDVPAGAAANAKLKMKPGSFAVMEVTK